jgi:hypothetical protein
MTVSYIACFPLMFDTASQFDYTSKSGIIENPIRSKTISHTPAPICFYNETRKRFEKPSRQRTGNGRKQRIEEIISKQNPPKDDSTDGSGQNSKVGGKEVFQLIWGTALSLAGLGVFYRVPQIMPKIAAIEHYASATGLIRVCFYIIGIILIGGGMRKIYGYYRKINDSGTNGNSRRGIV